MGGGRVGCNAACMWSTTEGQTCVPTRSCQHLMFDWGRTELAWQVASTLKMASKELSAKGILWKSPWKTSVTSDIPACIRIYWVKHPHS